MRVLLALAATIALTLSLSSVAQANAPDTAPGYTVLLYDDFDGEAGTLPDPNLWDLQLGTKYEGGPDNYGTGEQQRNTNDPANVSQDGQGNLRITALRNDPITDNPKSGWTAARVESKKADMKAPPGGIMKVEYRFQLPDRTGAAGLGYWPAIWGKPGDLRGNRYDWPRSGEFDWVENVQGREDELWNVLHCGVAGASWDGPCTEPTGIPNNGQARCQPTSCQKDLHEGRFEWDRSGQYPELRWYLDGTETFRITLNPALIAERPGIEQAWANFTGSMGFDVTMNIAMGGAFPDSRSYGGGPDGNTLPGGQLIVGYIKVSVTQGDGSVDPTPVPPNPPGEPTPPPAEPNPPVPPTPTPQPGTGDGSLTNGDVLALGSVDFGTAPLKVLKLRLKSNAAPGISGTIEVHAGSATGPIVGNPLSLGHGFSADWIELPLDTTLVGVHELFVTAASGQPTAFADFGGTTVG